MIEELKTIVKQYKISIMLIQGAFSTPLSRGLRPRTFLAATKAKFRMNAIIYGATTENYKEIHNKEKPIDE